jgi:protein-disulfide isomerase
MGCATAPSTSDLTAESADQTVNSQSSTTETGRSPAVPESSVKIIVYTDFQCGACERFHSKVEPEMRARYVMTGKAQIETRLLGALGDDSVRAAEAALCASEQGLFREYQEALFRAWREIDADAYSTEELVELAGSLGLDKEVLRRCLESGSKKSELEKNMKRAKADGVHTLPAVLIDGVKIEGYRPLDAYRVVEIKSPSQKSLGASVR